MPSWTEDDLSRIDALDEIDIVTQRQDGSLRKPVTIWIVRVGDELFVRSYKGRAGQWYRSTQRVPKGYLRNAGSTHAVEFINETDPGINQKIDAAYLSKYRRYGEPYAKTMIAPAVRITTIKLVPRSQPLE